jgi:hypothetical protein
MDDGEGQWWERRRFLLFALLFLAICSKQAELAERAAEGQTSQCLTNASASRALGERTQQIIEAIAVQRLFLLGLHERLTSGDHRQTPWRRRSELGRRAGSAANVEPYGTAADRAAGVLATEDPNHVGKEQLTIRVGGAVAAIVEADAGNGGSAAGFTGRGLDAEAFVAGIAQHGITRAATVGSGWAGALPSDAGRGLRVAADLIGGATDRATRPVRRAAGVVDATRSGATGATTFHLGVGTDAGSGEARQAVVTDGAATATVRRIGLQIEAFLAALLLAAFALFLFLFSLLLGLYLLDPQAGEERGESRTEQATQRHPPWETLANLASDNIKAIGVHD